jgi:hypothetical protein
MVLQSKEPDCEYVETASRKGESDGRQPANMRANIQNSKSGRRKNHHELMEHFMARERNVQGSHISP